METRLRTPEHIYECYVEYARPQNGEEPKLKSIYPKDYEFDEDTKKSLTSFLFPLKDSNTNSEEHFTFTLTNLEGQFRFGFCRYPAKGDVCMCFLSDLPWFKVFYRVMDKISDMQLDFQSELVPPFLKSLHTHPIPNLTSDFVLSIRLDNLDGHVFTFPLPNPRRLPEIPTDHNLTLFYPSLHHEVFLCMFANLMFERRIIITSNSLSMLSASIHSAASLLYPLFWQHIFIPITPPHLIDYCTAPMPFLMGIHSSILQQVKQMPINDAVILDVDQNELETPYADDLLRMPPPVIAQLRHTLKKNSSAYGDTLSRALLNCMVFMFGGYRKALKMREGESKVVFDEESFLQSRPQMGNFLSELFHFQHFQQFVNNRIDRLSKHKERDIFDEEAILFDEEGKSGKFSSEQLKMGLKEMKGILKKHGKEAWKSTGTLMNNTQKMLQGKMDLVGPGTSSVGFSSGKTMTFDGRTGSSTPPVTKRPPRPPMIPYESYVKQKEKLRQSIYIQENGTLANFLSGGIFNEDATSIDSKESGDSATGILIDLQDDMNMERSPIPIPMIIRPGTSDDDDETDSASIISSSSGSSGGNKTWDAIQNDDEVHGDDQRQLPVAPPRRRRQVKTPDTGGAVVGQLIDIHSEPQLPLIKPESVQHDNHRGSDSPLDGFASEIAESLGNLSKRYSDPLVATTVSNTSHDLFNLIPERDEEQSPTNDPWKPIPPNDPWKPVEISPNLKIKARPPPPKPQPYIGTGPKLFMDANAKQPGQILTPTSTASSASLETGTTQSSSSSQDPLADIFGNGGLHAYVQAIDTPNNTNNAS